MSGDGRELKQGDQVGKYEIVREVGRGTLGVAYLARHRLVNREAVIKLYTTRDSAVLALARRESEILASFDHPHIVSLYDAGEHEGYLYQVIEYVSGRALFEMVKARDRLPITVAVRLMIGLADALEHLHRLGFVHGGVDPRNIMVSTGGEPKLLGAPSLSAMTEASASLGVISKRPPYYSPEEWQGIRDRRADLWGLGMVFHTLLTGGVPCDGMDAREVERITVSPEPLDLSPLRASVPEPVTRTIERCLQKDPDRRYQSALEIRRDLESVLAFLESGRPGVPAPPLQPGRTIWLNVDYVEPGIPGQYREYRIEREVGAGSFSTVYAAQDTIGKRQVALKILREEPGQEERVLVRFQREAALLARLRHPNVVQVHNFGRYVTDYFIVMDLLGNLTLETALVRRFGFQVEHVVVIVAQVLTGLEALHAEGVVHRDAKPANVMLEPDRVVVMDLGLAHVGDASRLTVAGEILGTPCYMAPEQVRGEQVTVGTDVYAAGVMLFELLTGTIPYQADNVHSLMAKIAREEPECVTRYRQDLSPTLVASLRRMLARDPGERFASASSARSALLAGMGMQWSQIEGRHRQMYREVKAATKNSGLAGWADLADHGR